MPARNQIFHVKRPWAEIEPLSAICERDRCAVLGAVMSWPFPPVLAALLVLYGGLDEPWALWAILPADQSDSTIPLEKAKNGRNTNKPKRRPPYPRRPPRLIHCPSSSRAHRCKCLVCTSSTIKQDQSPTSHRYSADMCAILSCMMLSTSPACFLADSLRSRCTHDDATQRYFC
jgi:hypothetical protein